MRHILILVFCVAAFSINAQVQYRYGTAGPDTSTASQTHYLYPGTNTIAGTTKFKEAGDLEVYIKADSLSGATDGTITLQYAYTDASDADWYDAGTLTVNGPSSCTLRTQALNFSALKWRVRIVNSGATQSNRMIVAYTWKRRA